jgi:tetratricopeptide (TPR) repeat protein
MSFQNRIRRALKAAGRSLEYVAISISVLVCLFCATQALAFGLSRLYGARAFENKELSVADQAVLLAHSDPEAYSARAAVFVEQEKFTEAIVDLKHALDLSSHDCELWIKLGDCYVQVNDTAGAISAYSEATRLIPYYARAHWLLGNTLLKAGHIDEAFIEFRRASTSRPSLFVQAVELAWQSYDGDPHAVGEALQPQAAHERIALALFFGERGRTDEAVALMKEASHLPEDERLSLLKELLDTSRFVEAYAVWSAGRDTTDTGSSGGMPLIANGGFEGEIVRNDPGFGWRFKQSDRTGSTALDTRDPRTGLQSLCLDWNGDSDPSTPLVYQLVLVKPKSQYTLHFFARTEDLTTEALPLVAVVEVKGKPTDSLEGGSVLESSGPIRPDGSWQEYSVAFKTSDETEAVFVIIRRESCSNSPCPAYGRLWLDDFSLERLS